ncbi:MAG: hypothetical protein FJ303_02000 [Planctomycetes bacterium]|nr:hypothetical protein [Planctomycetota bacterium]
MRFTWAALTIALSLGIVGLASAQESGNWFTRWFTPTLERKSEKPAKEEVKPDTAKLQETINATKATQATNDWLRRQEICNRLMEIANATGDEDLRRKAQVLDGRAYDIYLATKNQIRTVVPSANETDTKKGGR